MALLRKIFGGGRGKRPSEAQEHANPKYVRTPASRPLTQECAFDGETFDLPPSYTIESVIGRGAYGVVAAGVDTRGRRAVRVAIKKVKNVFHEVEDGKRLLREVKVLRHFSHPNLMGIRAIEWPADYATFSELYIVSHLMESDLYHVICSSVQMSPAHICYLIFQLFTGLDCLHAAGVMHRDLKPSNVLVDSQCRLQLCDFGLARGFDDPDAAESSGGGGGGGGAFSTGAPAAMTEYVVTRWYRAPEVCLGNSNYGAAIDVWSVACIVCELVNRSALLPGTDYMNQLSRTFAVTGTPLESDIEWVRSASARRFILEQPRAARADFAALVPDADDALIDLIEEMLVINPTERITCERALEMEYFDEHRIPGVPRVQPGRFAFDFNEVRSRARAMSAAAPAPARAAVGAAGAAGLGSPAAAPAASADLVGFPTPAAGPAAPAAPDFERNLIRRLLWDEVCAFYPDARYAADAPSAPLEFELEHAVAVAAAAAAAAEGDGGVAASPAETEIVACGDMELEDGI